MGWKEKEPEKVPEKGKIKEVDSMTKAAQIAKASQTRYSFVKSTDVNPAVVNAGIKDNSLGKFGRSIIRFCYPAVSAKSKSTYNRIVIDPDGFPNPNHLHIPVPSALVTSTGYIQTVFQYMGNALFGLSIILSGARLVETSQNEGKEVIPEAALISAEYVGGFVGGAAGAKVGAVFGPVGSVIGAVSGSIVGSYYALDFVKNQEKLVVETTKTFTDKIS